MSNRILFLLLLLPSSLVSLLSVHVHKKTVSRAEEASASYVILEKLKDSQDEANVMAEKGECAYGNFDAVLKECGIRKYSFNSAKSRGNGSYHFECDAGRLDSVLACLNKGFLPFFPKSFFIEKKGLLYSVSTEVSAGEKFFKVSEKTAFLNKGFRTKEESFRSKKVSVHSEAADIPRSRAPEKKTYSVVGSVFSEDDFIYIKCTATGELKKVRKEKFNFKEFTYDEND